MSESSPPTPDILKATWPRFVAHWLAATLGFFLRSFLPVLKTWMDPATPPNFPRWWVALFFATLVCLLGGGIKSNLPAKPQDLLKSVGLGFAPDAAAVLANVNPL